MTIMLTTGEQQELHQIEEDLLEPTALMALGDGAWLDWGYGREPDHDASPAPGPLRPGATDPS